MHRLHRSRVLRVFPSFNYQLRVSTPLRCVSAGSLCLSTLPSGEHGDSSLNSDPTLDVPIRVPRPNEPIEAFRARLLYQARKRGILETDLLLSTFATRERLTAMSSQELHDLDSLMDQPDWDIYYWLTGKKPVPPEFAGTAVFQALAGHAKNKHRTILRMPSL